MSTYRLLIPASQTEYLEATLYGVPEDVDIRAALADRRLIVEPVLPANGEKQTCPKGHPYDGANTYIRPNGWRECRTCRDLRKERGRGGMAVTVRHYAPGGVS